MVVRRRRRPSRRPCRCPRPRTASSVSGASVSRRLAASSAAPRSRAPRSRPRRSPEVGVLRVGDVVAGGLARGAAANTTPADIASTTTATREAAEAADQVGQWRNLGWVLPVTNDNGRHRRGVRGTSVLGWPDHGGRTHAPRRRSGPGRPARGSRPAQAGGDAARGGAQRAQPRDREQAGADRLDLPRQLPPARSPTPIDRDQPNDRARRAARRRSGARPAPSPSGPRRPPRWPARGTRRPPAARARASPTGGGPARRRSTRCPAASSRSMSTMAFAIARAVPAFAAAGHEHQEHAGQAAGGPVPAEHRQQRDPDREREPRQRRALGPEVVPAADREHLARDEQRAPARRAARAAARQRGDDHDRPRRPAGVTRPAGIGLSGLPMWSTGASTRSLRPPIANWSAVIDTPEADGGGRCPRPRRARPAPTTAPSRIDGNGWTRRIAPSSIARAAARRRRLRLGRLVERGQRVDGRRPGAVRGRRLDEPRRLGGASIVRRRRAR